MIRKVVGYTTGSKGKVPGERKRVIRDDYDDDNKENTKMAKHVARRIHIIWKFLLIKL
jgi:hypothetical protein